jgi:hypothetical protein
MRRPPFGGRQNLSRSVIVEAIAEGVRRFEQVISTPAEEISSMPALTLKVLTSLLQMHNPDATLASDNQGVNALLGAVREQIAEEAKAAEAVYDPDAIEALYVPVGKREGGGSDRGRDRGGRNQDFGGKGGGAGGDSRRSKDVGGNPGGGGNKAGGGGSIAKTKPKEPKPFARTIFRKGDYGKSVYGPQHKRIDL